MAEVIPLAKANPKDVAVRFLFECSVKLGLKPLTSALASVLFHRFYKEVDQCEYDEFLIATSALHLAGKLKDDDPVKIRDVINVAHCTLKKTQEPLDLDDEYWTRRDSIVQAELLITRMLQFELSTVHPHKYLLHFMKALQQWFGPATWNAVPIAKTAAALLHDFHLDAAILNYKPSHIAICCLSIALKTYGFDDDKLATLCRAEASHHHPYDDTIELWYHVFVNDLSKELHHSICDKILHVYNTR